MIEEERTADRGVIIPRHKERLQEALKVQRQVWKMTPRMEEEALSALMEDVIQSMIDLDLNPQRMFNAAFTAAHERRKQFSK